MASNATDLLDMYIDSLQEIANQAWAHVPEEGDTVANFTALYDQIDADYETFRLGILQMCSTQKARNEVRAYVWKVEREA